jgi:tRNA-2-methylthio-N6-dimethylallyladenosine synthase
MARSMDPARVHITTYGCQMNRLDADLVAEVLRASGAEVVAAPPQANVLLFLTCSVRGHAEDRVFSNIGALGGRKRRRPGLVIGLLGCMAQQFGEEIRRRAPLVDIVCAPGRLAELPDLIARARAGAEATALDPRRRQAGAEAFAALDEALDGVEVRRLLGRPSAREAYVTVMRGCDNFCTYCVVPNVRGPERSRPPQSVLEEVRRLVGQGARRITFLGQAVNQYAAEEDGRRWDLADLVAGAAETPDLARLSFITSHPRAMTERLAAVFRDVPKVVPYLHMPAQSGSDAVLARMNRGYTAGEYEQRVARVRALRPGIAIESDFIVGFPGETAEDFEATVDLVRRVRFAGAFVFKYSPRPGTPAAERYRDDVPSAEKRRRHSRLLALVKEIAREQRSVPSHL